MTNEEMLFGLIISQEPEALLVAQDLAIELGCGLLNIIPHNTSSIGIIIKSNAGIYSDTFGLTGKLECTKRFTGLNNYSLSYSGINHRWCAGFRAEYIYAPYIPLQITPLINNLRLAFHLADGYGIIER